MQIHSHTIPVQLRQHRDLSQNMCQDEEQSDSAQDIITSLIIKRGRKLSKSPVNSRNSVAATT